MGSNFFLYFQSATPLNFKILLLDGNSEWKVNAGFHILIATPESLLKLVVDSKLHFKNTEYVVFDDGKTKLLL